MSHDAICASDHHCGRTIKALRQAANNLHLLIILLSKLQNHVPSSINTTVLWKPVKQASLYQALQFALCNRPHSDTAESSDFQPERHHPEPLPLEALSLTRFPLEAAPKSLANNELAPPGTDSEHRLVLPPALQRPQPSARLRILIAEDNLVNQRVALRLLKLLGYEASVASSGRAVLEMLEHQSYDVTLMDMRMPEIDGIKTTRQIRQMPQHQPIWIIAMTANATAQDKERCLNAGMNDYLSKPIDREALDRALKQCLTVRAVKAIG